jgi:SAM-dependent methyltransferase
MKDTAYQNLANWFEYLNDDCGYETWAQYLANEVEEYVSMQKLSPVGLDVGCGSGYFTRFLQKRGFSMTGLDVSIEMLDKARILADKEGACCSFLLGDVTKFKTPTRFSFVTAINDCFNYLPSEKLIVALRRVRDGLVKNGLFIFDVSSERKFYEKVANTVSVDDRDEVTYLSFNSMQDKKVIMDVTLFVKGEDGKYNRFDERHEQYVHTEEELVNALENVGFELLKVEGHLGEDKSNSDRICFIAKRK